MVRDPLPPCPLRDPRLSTVDASKRGREDVGVFAVVEPCPESGFDSEDVGAVACELAQLLDDRSRVVGVPVA